jgi:uncharacterized surface protein with fasciclin (FAS1) repeats
MTDSDPTPPNPSAPVPPPPPDAPTEVMPLTPPPDAAPGTVPVTPEEVDLPVPWYKKPGGIAAIVIGALLVIGLIFGLVWAGGGDEDDDVEAARVVLLAQDATGAALDQGFLAEATGTSDDPNSFNWLEPDTAAGIEGVEGTTGDSGRITFAWAPDAAVAEPEAWTSTISIVGNSPAGFTPPGPVVDCVLARPDEQDASISMDVVADPPDPTVDQVVTYTFPNHEFLPNDTVTCQLVSQLPPETTVPESTTTVPETTVPETTVPETTTTVPETTVPETTVPETTTPPTTAPETTAPETTTAPPAAPATATEALQAAGDYDTFLGLASGVPSVQALLDGAGPITVFAPNDAAFDGVTAPTDPDELELLLLSHIVDGTSLDAAQVFNGTRPDVAVASGGTQPVVQSPPTVGGATVVEADLASTSGFSHGIDALMPPAP